MTKDEALKLALEALNIVKLHFTQNRHVNDAIIELEQQAVQEPVACRFCHSKKGCWTWQCYTCDEIDDVQQPALPLPVQEPVGYVKGTYAGRLIYDTINPAVCLPVGMALYTAPLPVQRPWVGLTEEEIMVIGDKVANEELVGLVPNFRGRLARAIEQTLKELNK